MGYALLMLESLVWSLLLVAIAAAFAGRSHRAWLRLVLALSIPSALLLVHVGLTVLAGILQFRYGISSWFLPLLALTLSFAAGTVWLLVKGLRSAGVEGQPAAAPVAAAASWPRGKLAIALLAAVALYCMTWWNLDLAARQQLAALRVEAGARALSVAPARLPDRDNAAFVYQQAFAAMGRESKDDDSAPGAWLWDDAWRKAWEEKWTTWEPKGTVAFDVHDPELRRFLARQAPALKLLRQAAAMPGCNFDRDYGRPNISMSLPELRPLQRGARLLALDAVYSAAEGNPRQAIEDINATSLMAEQIGGDPLLVCELLAVIIDHVAIDTLQIVLVTYRVPANELTAVRIADNVSFRALLRRGCRYEEAFRLSVFDDLGSGRTEFGQVMGILTGRGPWSNSLTDWLFDRCYRVFLLGDDLAAHRQATSELEQAVRLPYWQAKKRMDELGARLHDKPGGILTALLVPSLHMVMAAAAAGDARRDSARLGLALYAYRARNGKFPGRLDDLVPEFMASVPTNPFDSESMKMQRTERGITVYCVGPLKDNRAGGFPLDGNSERRDITFTVPDAAAAKK